jgi:hypothetical protein
MPPAGTMPATTSRGRMSAVADFVDEENVTPGLHLRRVAVFLGGVRGCYCWWLTAAETWTRLASVLASDRRSWTSALC